MFDLPSAKRVKRSELFDNANSEDEDHIYNTVHEAESPKTTTPALNYSFEYEIIHQTAPQSSRTQSRPAAPEEAEVFAFNLFRPTKKPPQTTEKAALEPQNDALEQQQQSPLQQGNLISIRSPSPPAADGSTGKLSRARPDSDYFTSALPEAVQRQLKASYDASAVSASEVLALSRTPWPGAALSLRVINLPAHKRQIVIHKRGPSNVSRGQPYPSPCSSTSGVKHDGGNGDADSGESGNGSTRRRPRPSKKRRLMLTARSRHRQMLIDETKTKEEHEREKKNQKNRERKMKRRAKERREKAEKVMGKEEAEMDV